MSNKNQLSDAEIIKQLQAGDMRKFSLLADRYEGYLLKKCKSYVKDEDAAEDLTQEILIKVFLKVKDFHYQANFTTWLYAIIHHTCIDYLRKNKKKVHQVLTEKMTEEVVELIDEVDELPEEVSVEIFEQLLEEIGTEEKLIILLKYKEKHSIKDIQEALNLSESAIKMRLKRAKEKLQKLYHQYQRKN